MIWNETLHKIMNVVRSITTGKHTQNVTQHYSKPSNPATLTTVFSRLLLFFQSIHFKQTYQVFKRIDSTMANNAGRDPVPDNISELSSFSDSSDEGLCVIN